MEHITDTRIEQSQPTAVTLGNFDGLHLGHRSLINLTKQFAEEQGLKSVVFTFSPHPMLVFKKKDDFALIMAPDEKKFQMEQMGVDTYIEYPFDAEFAAMSPEDFAIKLIFEKLNCQVLVVGEDYHFGKGAAGNYEMLKELGAERGIMVIGVPKVLHDEERVSSSRIRKCLIEHDLEDANQMLTVPYFILGTVKEGKKLGRTIGFPTANIAINDVRKLLPKHGVYAVRAKLNDDDTIYNGMLYIGERPTIVTGSIAKSIEVHLFHFSGDIYHRKIRVEFLQYVRDEARFDSMDSLARQLEMDRDDLLLWFKEQKFD